MATAMIAAVATASRSVPRSIARRKKNSTQGKVEIREERRVADFQMKGRTTGEREKTRKKEDAGQVRQLEAPRQQEVHPQKPEEVMKHDVQLHRERQRNHQREQIHRAEQRDLRVLPEHVAGAKPRIPEWELAEPAPLLNTDA